MIKVAFLQNLYFELYGIMSLSAILKQNGYQCELLLGSTNNIISNVDKFNPNVVAMSCVYEQRFWVKRVAKAVKKINKDILVIVGGPHPTFYPDLIENSDIDVICRGEGEYPLLEFVNSLGNGNFKNNLTNIKNLWIKRDSGEMIKNNIRPLIENLDELPWADREIYYKNSYFKNNPVKRFMVGRGCPYECNFCFNIKLKELYKGLGKYCRLRSAENIIEEIKYVKSKYPLQRIHFYDDLFIFNKKWLFDFLNKYESKIKIPFRCGAKADLIDDDVIKRLKYAGCAHIEFGIETGNENLRRNVLNKNITDKQIINASKILHKYDIEFSTTNMFAIPGETLSNALETVKLNMEVKPATTWASILQLYPGLPITEYSLNNGYLKKVDIDNNVLNSFQKSPLKRNKELGYIFNLHKFFSILVYSPYLLNMIKFIIKFDFLFQLYYSIFILIYGITYGKRNNLGLFRSLREGIYIIRYNHELKAKNV